MVSPLLETQVVDRDAVEKLTIPVVEAGAVPFVLGSTGEGYSLSLAQKLDILQSTVKAVSNRCPVFAGISPNSFSNALKEAECFAESGAGVLVVTLPFYYPIDEQQMMAYFTLLANKLPLPLIIYNMPGMVKRSIPLDLADELSKHENIVGIKDSERDEKRLTDSIGMWARRDDFSFFIGWAAMSYKGLSLGADGIVPSTGNLMPQLYCDLYNSISANEHERAKELQLLTNNISKLYQEGRDLCHSIPALKLMLSLQGKCMKTVAPPMFEMSEADEKRYIEFVVPMMKEFGCLNR